MSDRLHICFVCSGNICRSPMAQNIVRAAVAQAGLSQLVLVDSCGIGAWHVGEPADDRARTELRRHGYSDDHVAAVLGRSHAAADLLIAMDRGHLRALVRQRLGDRTRLLRSFDPTVGDDDLDVVDPYYGGADDFARVRAEIEAATPGLLAWITEQVRRRHQG
ncbi:low molecular weight protein-tyrosine-phosphatase [Williamsia sp. CHRR-6]|uniref:low molecular weight protein-tyrosine-phosphatase n=1 Tax=Williamsia sp. CHRR-6 TaxID=2835871 RepID=UPI001BD93158|nr:low molecular weight protein-tyrosine-phosphatase [Williamsia sp. CHRR-6]MBT0565341.1 low molecular weight phosphotyrosine protein phosphatase [Williamsia sp. CHRR-6]